MALSEQKKMELIHALLSEYRYYKVETSNRWSRSLRGICSQYGLVKQNTFEFYIKNPSSQVLQEANRIYNETIEHFRFNDYLTSETVVDWMKKQEVLCEETRLAEEDEDLDPVYFWSDNEDQKMKVLSEAIENIKVKLFKNSDASSKVVDEIRADLRKSQKMYNEMYVNKHQFDYLTTENVAFKLYSRYLYDHTFYAVNGQQITGLPPFLLDNIASVVRDNSITGTQLRELAHTSPWLQYHKTGQNNLFANITLSDDILHLTSLTRWYEWVRERPTEEKPSDKVIDDDDMLDGWYILWERNRPKKTDLLIESSKRNVETFIMANSPMEADEIYMRNNKMARVLMKNRANQVLGSNKPIQDHELGDVKFDLGIEANKLGIQAAQAKAAGYKTPTGPRK